MKKTATEHFRLNFPKISGVPVNKSFPSTFSKSTSGSKVVKLVRKLSGYIGGAQAKFSGKESITRDWAKMMKKHNNQLEKTIIEHERPTEYFCTGSSYTGIWNDFGMCGEGMYEYLYGVQYDGEMDNGMFHGIGTLTYPRGHKMEGIWDKGKLVSFKYIFGDGLAYGQNGNYCKYPDRRFFSSLSEGLRPAPKERLTNRQPPRKIPNNCYDVGDGFYNPKTKCIFVPSRTKIINEPQPPANEVANTYNSTSDTCIWEADTLEGCDYWVMSIPLKKEANWIMTNCRKAWDEPTGYRPNIYEHWTVGRAKEVDAILSEFCNSDVVDSIATDLKNMLALRVQNSVIDTKKFFDLVDDLLADVFNVTDIKF